MMHCLNCGIAAKTSAIAHVNPWAVAGAFPRL